MPTRGAESARLRGVEIAPLGDSAVLARFDKRLSDEGNRAALDLAARLGAACPDGVIEIAPSLVSVLVRYDPSATTLGRLSGEIGLLLSADVATTKPDVHKIDVCFDGPDLPEVADTLGLSVDAFVSRHNVEPLRVLTTGFAPGFVYCGLHDETLVLPRRERVRPEVPAGSILFAAGQTAVTATAVPTGWHVIGHTPFRNFVPDHDPPTLLKAGDLVRFGVSR